MIMQMNSFVIKNAKLDSLSLPQMFQKNIIRRIRTWEIKGEAHDSQVWKRGLNPRTYFLHQKQLFLLSGLA